MGTLQAPSSAPLAGLRAKRLGREVAAAAVISLLAMGGLAGSLEPLAVVAPAQAQTAERIVAAGGVVTEVLYALGQQDKVVGVDTTSQWPPEALKDKKSVGYVRALSAEGVLSLKPSQVIAVEGAGPPDALALLKESGTPITMIPEALSPEAVVGKIAAIGKAAGVAEPAQKLAATVKGRFDELDKLRAGLPKQKRVLFVLSLQNGRIMVGGRATTADAIITLAGGAGRRFNLGEATVTRCVVRLDSGAMGFSYALGRDGRKARLAAITDALLQGEIETGPLRRGVFALAQKQQAARELASRKAAATKVDFFTLVRGG